MIRALTHIAVRVTDLDRALAFYRDVLGLQEQFRLTDESGRPMLVYVRINDDQFIELFPGAAAPHSHTDTAGTVHICLLVDDIQHAFAEVTGRGAVPHRERPILGADGSWQFWVSDPDGTPIEFHQFTPDSLQRSHES